MTKKGDRPPPLTPAERKRRSRENLRHGVKVLPVRVVLGEVADWLVDSTFLEAWDSEDPTLVAEALAQAIRAWSRR